MMILSGGLNTTGWICRKHEKIEKVTGSQDDEFVGGLNTTGSIGRKHEKIEKVTGSQDDEFVGGLNTTDSIGRKHEKISTGAERSGEICGLLCCPIADSQPESVTQCVPLRFDAHWVLPRSSSMKFIILDEARVV